jgi:pimeloyl-ACP methyl ester carboxylesterase
VRIAPLALLSLAILSASSAQSPSSAYQISANFLLDAHPQHPALSAWNNAGGRYTLTTIVPGAMLRGYLYPGKDAKAPTILVFNGPAAGVNDEYSLYRRLAALGPTVVAYDARGTGFSTGKTDVSLLRDDALRIFDNLPTLRPQHKIIVYGVALGSALATYVASQRPVAAMVLAAPIASAAEELRIYGQIFGQPFLSAVPSPEAVRDLDVAGMVAQSHAPLLVIQRPRDSDDTLIPLAQAREVFAAGTASKQLVLVPAPTLGEMLTRPASLHAVQTLLASLPPNTDAP